MLVEHTFNDIERVVVFEFRGRPSYRGMYKRKSYVEMFCTLYSNLIHKKYQQPRTFIFIYIHEVIFSTVELSCGTWKLVKIFFFLEKQHLMKNKLNYISSNFGYSKTIFFSCFIFIPPIKWNIPLTFYRFSFYSYIRL